MSLRLSHEVGGNVPLSLTTQSAELTVCILLSQKKGVVESLPRGLEHQGRRLPWAGGLGSHEQLNTVVLAAVGKKYAIAPAAHTVTSRAAGDSLPMECRMCSCCMFSRFSSAGMRVCGDRGRLLWARAGYVRILEVGAGITATQSRCRASGVLLKHRNLLSMGSLCWRKTARMQLLAEVYGQTTWRREHNLRRQWTCCFFLMRILEERYLHSETRKFDSIAN